MVIIETFSFIILKAVVPNDVIVEGNVIMVTASHPLNASLPTDSTPSGRFISFRLVQPLNAPVGILVSFPPFKEKDCKPVQDENA